MFSVDGFRDMAKTHLRDRALRPVLRMLIDSGTVREAVYEAAIAENVGPDIIQQVIDGLTDALQEVQVDDVAGNDTE